MKSFFTAVALSALPFVSAFLVPKDNLGCPDTSKYSPCLPPISGCFNCIPCPDNAVGYGPFCNAKPGYYSDAALACTPGNYCPGGDTFNTRGDQVACNATLADSVITSPAGSKSIADCVCPTGYTGQAGVKACEKQTTTTSTTSVTTSSTTSSTASTTSSTTVGTTSTSTTTVTTSSTTVGTTSTSTTTVTTSSTTTTVAADQGAPATSASTTSTLIGSAGSFTSTTTTSTQASVTTTSPALPACNPLLASDPVTNPCPAVTTPAKDITDILATVSIPNPDAPLPKYSGDAVQVIAKLNIQLPAALGNIDPSKISGNLFAVTEDVSVGKPVSFAGATFPSAPASGNSTSAPTLNAIVLLVTPSGYKATAVGSPAVYISANVNAALTSDGFSITYVVPTTVTSVWYAFSLNEDGSLVVLASSGTQALASVTFSGTVTGSKKRAGSGPSFAIVTAVAPVEPVPVVATTTVSVISTASSASVSSVGASSLSASGLKSATVQTSANSNVASSSTVAPVSSVLITSISSTGQALTASKTAAAAGTNAGVVATATTTSASQINIKIGGAKSVEVCAAAGLAAAILLF
ncbi:hypothetical protein BCR33DRAFT_784115 [Rhizoclosmatium globosum]|uniref:TNFR-Cys domain-containing protein n=1 Tax=Rhizoclosmatium globosum TaxID=329046 RepID=A0A1Y2CI65_9FUNG|nr:hypothetical protein BCR33DRAFT_784115 [Rhizoclosmatium globosum]|eukprot:ORY45995.1 hypothetical protein BCR33DRAFT_784115 [Rhizoclosmatium globosum]